MKLTHNEIEKKNIIENYVMGRLNQEEELAFEEHILSCDECRQKCDHLQKIIEASENKLIAENIIKQTEDSRKVKSGVQFRILLGTAASLVILVGTIFLILNTRKPSYIATYKESITDSVVISSDNNKVEISDKNDTTAVEKNEIPEEKYEKNLPDNQQKSLIAQAYHTHPVFESAIENQLRSNGISVSSPQNSEIYTRNQEIKFNWETDARTDLVLIIRDNSGIILFKEKVPSDYIYRIKALGLYYWQLMDNNDIIYTGKFLVK